MDVLFEGGLRPRYRRAIAREQRNDDNGKNPHVVALLSGLPATSSAANLILSPAPAPAESAAVTDIGRIGS
jgi:hypothetical protein